MEKKQTDWRKYRKSSHLASADLDAMETDGLPLIFTIKEISYQTGVDVSGTKKDGVFCQFVEGVKPLLLNSTNLKTLSSLVKGKGITGKDAYIIENYIGLTIQLFVDRNVKMMGQVVDGIRISPKLPEIKPKEKPLFTEEKFENAKSKGATIEQIKQHYTVTEEIETKYNNYGAEK
jgi:hypothetical protein